MLPLYATMNSGVHWLGLRFRFPGGRWITSAFLSMMKTSSALIRSFCTPEGAINILSGLSRIVSEPPDPGNKVIKVESFNFWYPLSLKNQSFANFDEEEKLCKHGLRTTRESFIFLNPKLLGLGRQIGPKFYEAFGVFLAKL